MNEAHGNPLDFLQNMWNQMGFQLPGMVTPTLDENELDKQIKDLRSVENWLRMNLSMLQMTIQNLEMQKSALATFRSMGENFAKAENPATPPESPLKSFFQAAQAAATTPAQPTAATNEADIAKAAMWPWEMMHELNAKMQAQLAENAAQKPPAQKTAAAAATKPKATTAKKPTTKRSAGKS